MEQQTILEMVPFEMFRFRALVERDGAICVATCLETGSVATSDDEATAVDIMAEVLRDEWEYNVRTGSLRNLFTTPAPIAKWAEWQARDVETHTLDGIEWKLLPHGAGPCTNTKS